ncbi:rab11 family-interacting protein 4B isoform X1 [Hemibagrus wyckioides]|uniref:rab11 family-interacting protein 4B isoform X1 n=2 Tax=Hemibagrus wyckioides TaxID=337641 RepID=UPI00266B43EE|nr:rab11 family-interacting protein 4B isoform X1 [Hemibagrus wyckioides]
MALECEEWTHTDHVDAVTHTLREVMSVSVKELYDDEEARESDRDSAIESAAGSELSDSGKGGDKEEGLRMFLPRQKSGEQSLNPSVTSDLSTRSLNEEQFEDYGEGDDVDYSPISPEDETHTNGFSDLGSSVPSSATHTPQKVRQVSGDHEVFCSNCCKKVTQLNELETRLKNLKTHSPNKKISSTAFGRQLLYHSNLSSRNGSTEDLFREGSIDYCDTDIADKVSQLEKKLYELENESLMNTDVQSKLKQENTNLVHRVHELEEQLKEQEARAEQIMESELRRHRDAFNKLERDKKTEIEILNNRVQQLEVENTEMLASVNRLKMQTEKLDEEKQRMTDKLEDTSLRLKDEMDLYRKMMDKLRQNRNDYQREREAMQELIEELRRELEHLQLYKLEAERLGRIRRSSISLSDYSTRTRESDLEQEMKRLKQRCVLQDIPPDLQQRACVSTWLYAENQRLREQNEELNGQIISLSLHEAKNLISTQTKAQSLAAEIENASRDQLMEALKEQEEINIRLRQYMDKIILSILDHNPSILEIKY